MTLKPLSHIFLFFVITMLSGGGIALFKVQQVLHKRHVFQTIHLHNTAIKKITLSASAFKQGKLNKDEICLQGKMYDIKSIQIRGNQVDLFLIKDSFEDSIIKKMSALSEDDPNNDFPPAIFQFLVLDYVLPDLYAIPLMYDCSKVIYIHYEENIGRSPFSTIDKPPKAAVQATIA